MPRDKDADKLRPDTNEIAYGVVQAALGGADKPTVATVSRLQIRT